MSDTSDIDYSKPAVLPDDDDHLLDRVEWHVRMARAKQAELDEVLPMFQREIDKLKERMEDRKRILRSEIAWHTAPVESYHRMRQAEEPARKTIHMPHGVSKVTVPQKAEVYIDGDHPGADELVHAWLAEHHRESFPLPNITTIRNLVDVLQREDGERVVIDKKTGEVVDGLVAVVPPITHKLTLEPGAPL